MPNWLPFAEAGAALPEALRPAPAATGAVAGAGQAFCSQCGHVFPADDVVAVGGYNVCAACKPLLLQKLQQGMPNVGVYGAPTLRFAGFWIRFGALILDSLIVLPVSLLLNYLFKLTLTGTAHVNPLDPQNSGFGAQSIGGTLAALAVYYLIIVTLYAVYNGICMSRFGGMPGMLICGLRVIRPDGARLTFWRGVGRYFANYLSGMSLGIGYLFVAFDDQKRALHDYVCDTRVVYK